MAEAAPMSLEACGPDDAAGRVEIVPQIIVAASLFVLAALNAVFDLSYRFLQTVPGGRNSAFRRPVARFYWRWFTSAFLVLVAFAVLLGHPSASA
jgi:hypothetical protein